MAQARSFIMRNINFYKSWPVALLCAVALSACDRTDNINELSPVNENIQKTFNNRGMTRIAAITPYMENISFSV
jgi:hypothetical protein